MIMSYSITSFYIQNILYVRWNVSLERETEILARGPINKPITIIGICDYPNNANTPGYGQHAYMRK